MRVEALEHRALLASLVLEDSAFNPAAFIENVGDFLDTNTVGYNVAVNYDGVVNAATGTGGKFGANDGRARTDVDEPETVMTTTTRMEVASVSKVITTVGVLKLLEDHPDGLNAALSKPIRDYLPQHWNPGPWVDSITVWHLLTHTSGFQEQPAALGTLGNPIGVNFDGFGLNNFDNLRDLYEVGVGIPSVQFPHDPDTAASPRSYNNANFSLLAKMIPYMIGEFDQDETDYLNQVADTNDGELDGEDPDEIFGIKYKEWVRDNVLVPAGIDSPDMDLSGLGDNPARGYRFDTPDGSGVAMGDVTNTGGAFGWKLSSPDLGKFLLHVRSGAVFSDSATLDLMNDPDFLLGWSPSGSTEDDHDDDPSTPDLLTLRPFRNTFGSHYEHGGSFGADAPEDEDSDAPAGRIKSQIVMFPGNVEAALILNNDTDSDAVTSSNFELMRDAYKNAWSHLVIQGDVDPNTFEIAEPIPGVLDIFIDDELFISLSDEWLETLELRGEGGNDTFIVPSLPAGVHLVLEGGLGSNTFEIGVQNLLTVEGAITIAGSFFPTDFDRVVVNDSAGGGVAFTLSDNTISTPYSASPVVDYTNVESVELVANTASNVITISHTPDDTDITVLAEEGDDIIDLLGAPANVEIELFGQGDADVFTVRDSAARINVWGGDFGKADGDDELHIGGGNLHLVGGELVFSGQGGNDTVYLDAGTAGTSVDIDFQAINSQGKATWTGGGELRYTADSEVAIFHGSKHGDTINIHRVNHGELEVFGHAGDDNVFLSPVARDLDDIEGAVTVHGNDGVPNHRKPKAVDVDTLVVRDDNNGLFGNYAVNAAGLFAGFLEKMEETVPRFRVDFDGIEDASLHANDGDNDIIVHNLPWFTEFSAHAGGGADRIVVHSVWENSGPVFLRGEDGGDTIEITPTGKNLGAIQNSVHVDGGDGTDGLFLEDQLSGNANPYSLTALSFSRAGAALMQYAGIEQLNADLSDEDNQFQILGTAANSTTSIFGHGGDDVLTVRQLSSDVAFTGNGGIDAHKSVDAIRHENRRKRGGAGAATTDGRREPPVGRDIEPLSKVIAEEPSPERAALVAELFELLIEQLNQAGDADLLQIAVSRMLGDSKQDIAAQLGCSCRTVERKLTLIHRIWQRHAQ